MALEPILYRSEEAVFDKAGLEKVKVTAKVVAHVRGEKLRVFKFKPKRGYKRRTGHRQELTRIEVTEIAPGRAKRPKPPARRESLAGAKAAATPSHAAKLRQGESARGRQARAAGKAPARPRKARKETTRWLIRRGSAQPQRARLQRPAPRRARRSPARP